MSAPFFPRTPGETRNRAAETSLMLTAALVVICREFVAGLRPASDFASACLTWNRDVGVVPARSRRIQNTSVETRAENNGLRGSCRVKSHDLGSAGDPDFLPARTQISPVSCVSPLVGLNACSAGEGGMADGTTPTATPIVKKSPPTIGAPDGWTNPTESFPRLLLSTDTIPLEVAEQLVAENLDVADATEWELHDAPNLADCRAAAEIDFDALFDAQGNDDYDVDEDDAETRAWIRENRAWRR